jgi:serine/threonine protein kinase
MCALLPPFRAQDFPGLYQAVTTGQFEDIPKGYTKSLKDFINLCLKIQPSERPSAAQLLEKTYFAEYELSIEMVNNEL